MIAVTTSQLGHLERLAEAGFRAFRCVGCFERTAARERRSFF